MCSRAFETRSFPTRSLLPSQFYLLCRFSHQLHSTFSVCPSMLLASPRLHSRSYPRHFTFHAWRAVASAKAGRSSHSLHSGDVMANEQSAVSRVADREDDFGAAGTARSTSLPPQPASRAGLLAATGLARTPRHSEATTRERYRSYRDAIRDSRIATFANKLVWAR
jgi:hypothetical protein